MKTNKWHAETASLGEYFLFVCVVVIDKYETGSQLSAKPCDRALCLRDVMLKHFQFLCVEMKCTHQWWSGGVNKKENWMKVYSHCSS